MSIFEKQTEASMPTKLHDPSGLVPERAPLEERVRSLEDQLVQVRGDLETGLIKWMNNVDHKLNIIMRELNL